MPKVPETNIPMLPEDNVRTGFFEGAMFDVSYAWWLENALEYSGFILFGYMIPWRVDNIRNLTWYWIDMDKKIIRLRAQDTKGKKASSMKIEKTLMLCIEEQWEKRIKDLPYVFHVDGKKIVDIRPLWNRACRETGLGYGYKLTRDCVEKWEKKGLSEGPLFHDFRRTGVRNLRRAGGQETVAMTISGHKTRNVFDRNDISDDRDLEDAAKKLEEYREERLSPNFGKSDPNFTNFLALLILLNQLKSLVPRAGLEPARWGATEGF